jgi:hypothetical protein
MKKTMNQQTNVDVSCWSFEKDYPHILVSLGVVSCPSPGPHFEERFQHSFRDVWPVELIPVSFGSRSMPTFPGRHVVLVRKEPKIALLEYADVEHHVLRLFEAQGLFVSSSLHKKTLPDHSCGKHLLA